MNLLSMVLDKLSIVELEKMAVSGTRFEINDGSIVGVKKEKTPTNE